MSQTIQDPAKRPIKWTVLQAVPIPALPGWEQRMVLLEYPAGAAAPAHDHPIAGPNYVVQGAVSSQWEGDREPTVYRAGESSVDHAMTTHTEARNVSETEDLKLIACYVVRLGSQMSL